MAGMIPVVGLALLFGGCTGSLSDKQRAQLSCVSLDPNVNIQEFVYSGGQSQAAFLLGGIVGTAIGRAAGMERTEKDEILDVMREHKIDIKQIMVAEFEKELAAKPKFPPRVAAGGDARFRFKMTCMLAQKAFSKKMAPEFYLWGWLDTQDGGTLWKGSTWVNQHIQGHTHAEYVQNPELLREVYTQACAMLAKKLAKGL